jgi:mersacidin/lichenicidin family type 2 lantibiotic
MSHLNTIDIIRAWKDPEYRLSLSEGERALLPLHPSGLIELADSEMHAIAGGAGGSTVTVDGQICCSSGDACITAGPRPTPSPTPTPSPSPKTGCALFTLIIAVC